MVRLRVIDDASNTGHGDTAIVRIFRERVSKRENNPRDRPTIRNLGDEKKKVKKVE